jgi:hypothetical protein
VQGDEVALRPRAIVGLLDVERRGVGGELLLQARGDDLVQGEELVYGAAVAPEAGLLVRQHAVRLDKALHSLQHDVLGHFGERVHQCDHPVRVWVFGAVPSFVDWEDCSLMPC